MPKGQCHCGEIRYSVDGDLQHSSVCHCADCRRATGGLTIGWVCYPGEGLTIESGETRVYNSSEGVERHFCGQCGTSLFYFNEAMLPGVVDIPVSTLDDPENYPPEVHIQMADALPWEPTLASLPRFERFPG